MNQLLNSTISLRSSLNELYNATKTNSNVILGCFSYLKKLNESAFTEESSIESKEKNAKDVENSISVIERCFTYLTTDHNHIAIAANNIGRTLYNHLEALRKEKADVHSYLCDEELMDATSTLEKAKNARDSYYESNVKSSSSDTFDVGSLKAYEALLINYNTAKSKLDAKIDQCKITETEELTNTGINMHTTTETQDTPITNPSSDDQQVDTNAETQTSQDSTPTESAESASDNTASSGVESTTVTNLLPDDQQNILNQQVEENIYIEQVDSYQESLNDTINITNSTETVSDFS